MLLACVFAMVGAFLVGYVSLQKLAEAQIMLVLDYVSKSAADKTEFRYRNVRVSLWERAVRVNGISIRPVDEKEALRIDRVSLSEIDWDTVLRITQTGGAPTLPRTVRVGFNGMHLTPRLLGSKAAAKLKELGYDEIDLSMSMGLLLDRRRKIFGVDDLNVEVADMGRLSFSIELGNVDMPSDGELLAIKINPETAKAQVPDFEEITLRWASVRYDDLSLLGRIDQKMKSEGSPGLSSLIEIGSRLPASSDGFVAEAVGKFKTFVSAPDQTLEVSVRPADPMAFSSMGLEALAGPGQLAEKLNLTIEVR